MSRAAYRAIWSTSIFTVSPGLALAPGRHL
jgi:hypothetical protein